MDNLELLVNFHKDAKRQGPGSAETTLKALKLTQLNLENNLTIADIGCGTGAQTLVLAKNTKGIITAIDLFPEFLDKLKLNAKAYGFDNQINCVRQSMENLDFQHSNFDLIWSEGAIYIIGFEKGIKAWSKFLKKDGYLAVTEISWITNSRPKVIEDYWNNAYPEIDTITNKVNQLKTNGFSSVLYFVLPEHCWLDNYYHPMQERFSSFLKKYNHSKDVQELVNAEKEEVKMYNTYKSYYS
ncbi:MAG: class I SAM-dependent methyltransferase, partial [Flavobacteriaceae bacterium]|nr:class I SAM-dependent methyltransferase [Flavobacteriaceae bacterium]